MSARNLCGVMDCTAVAAGSTQMRHEPTDRALWVSICKMHFDDMVTLCGICGHEAHEDRPERGCAKCPCQVAA